MWKSVVYVDLSKVIKRTSNLLSGMDKVSFSALGKLGCLVAGGGTGVVGVSWALCKVHTCHLIDRKNMCVDELREQSAIRVNELREQSEIRKSEAEFLNSLPGRPIWRWK